MILVTGATNFVGRAVVRHLTSTGRSVCCLIQPSHFQQELVTDVSFSTQSAALDDPMALRAALEGVTTVLHLTREEESPREHSLEDHVEGTRNLVAAARRAGVSRFIYLSRLGATPASAYPLFSIKGQAEIAVAESGLAHTNLRAAVIYGSEDIFTTRLVMLAKMIPLILPIPAAGMVRFQPVWVEDLARCIVETAERKDLIGRMIPIGGPEHFTLEQLVRRVLEAAGMRRRLLHISMPLMQSSVETLETLLGGAATPDWWLDLAAVGNSTELGTIPKHFHFEPSRFSQCLIYLRRKRPWRRTFVRHLLGR